MHPIRLSIVACGLVSYGLLLGAANAADSFWINSGSGTFSGAANWDPGVPGSGDNANFTNGTSYTVSWTADANNSNAFFNGPGGTVGQAIGSSSYSLSSSYIVGQNAGSVASVEHTSGTLAVTNASGTASMVIGQSGNGTYTLNGGTVFADLLFVTNGTSSTFTFTQGTLNTLHGSTFNQNILAIGGAGASAATWNILGGTSLVTGTDLRIGTGSSTGTVVVSGPGTLLTNSGLLTVGFNGVAFAHQLIITNGARVETSRFQVGDNTGGNRLTIVDGGVLFSGDGTTVRIGGGSAADNNTALVSGSNSAWIVNGVLSVGRNGEGNSLTIAAGGLVTNNDSVFMGEDDFGRSNTITVTDSGSRFYVGDGLYIGYWAGANRLVVSNGGFARVKSSVTMGVQGASDENSIVVTGTGSLLSIGTGLTIGDGGASNQMTISNGGQVRNTSATIGAQAISVANSVLVTDAGSSWTNLSGVTVGSSGSGSLTVSNGASVYSGYNFLKVGANVSGSGNVVVTGPGSLLQDLFSTSTPGDWGTLYVGSNQVTSGTGTVLVENGGTIEYNRIVSAFAGTGTISNRNGIYQFTTATPTITNNNPTGGGIVLTDGAISFRNITDANPAIAGTVFTNITFVGDNTFMLNNASNATGLASYTFTSGSPSTIYQRLALVNGGSRWRSSTLTVASSGALLVSNSTAATIAANLTSAGGIRVVNSKVTYESNVVISGSYVSSASTNTFLADATVTSSGFLAGGAGDLFDSKKSLYIQSANNTAFDLDSSTVLFSGGGEHTNAITGQDFGSNAVGYVNNFAYGELALATGADELCLQSGNAAPSNALYVGWLHLPGTNPVFIANLHTPTNINLYYDMDDPRNDYLADMQYTLTDCDGFTTGGLLLPASMIPEPSSAMLFLAASMVLACRAFRIRS